MTVTLAGETDRDVSDMIRKVVNRGAVLFLGSGFSASASGLDGEDMPIAEDLARQIGTLGGFDAEKDLMYASSKFLDDGKEKSDLIRMLRETFTVREVKEHHKQIAKAPWRKVYTTNYDLCFERAAEQNGSLVETVDLTSPPSKFSARRNVCVHLNGSLSSLSEESFESGFKLTTSSYLSPNSFLTSLWSHPFQRDLELASAIIFIGYSMYDIDIQKILHQNSNYKQKTFFITRSPKVGREKFTLEQFGTIVPIGAEAFGAALSLHADEFLSQEESNLSALAEYKLSEEPFEARDAHADAFLMRGEISNSNIDSIVAGRMGAPQVIERQELRQAIELARAGSDIAIIGDFGNGKSTLLKLLRALLTAEGFPVFTAEQADINQQEDLELLVRGGEKGFLLIDNYEQNFDLVSHYAELKPSKLRLIISARTNVHERLRERLLQLELNPAEVSVDELSAPEAEEFVDIIDNLGYWGDKAALAHSAKVNTVLREHSAQLSMNLLALLSSPQMVQRVRDLIHPLLSNPKYRDTVFAIAVLSANNLQLSSSLVADVAFNNEIFGSGLRDHPSFKQLFTLAGTRISTKSSIFALLLISRQFESAYITEQLLKIVASIENSRAELYEKRELQKSLLRFSVVERLLPEAQRMQNLVNYYEKLKREVAWLKSDPHYWLQYGMARLTYKDYDKAQSYFDQAYALADSKYKYHTNHIDTQQARLYLYRATTNSDPAASFAFFADANRHLSRTPDDVHKYRQVERYTEVYEQRFSSFSKANKTNFEHACKLMLRSILKTSESNEAFAKHKVTIRALQQLQLIVTSIEASRGKLNKDA